MKEKAVLMVENAALTDQLKHWQWQRQQAETRLAEVRRELHQLNHELDEADEALRQCKNESAQTIEELQAQLDHVVLQFQQDMENQAEAHEEKRQLLRHEIEDLQAQMRAQEVLEVETAKKTQELEQELGQWKTMKVYHKEVQAHQMLTAAFKKSGGEKRVKELQKKKRAATLDAKLERGKRCPLVNKCGGDIAKFILRV
ncbi:involucrin-like [Synchiropus splendidus]|uniref:involucrin-like n=1 Tax=Synchiropus splendidus TaxID=270530 RepID=UPI00237EB2EE|nr:involucrin-like [Synchiropus splendidus]